MSKTSRIHIGIGGWTFAPWRGVFYPQGLAHARELEYAASHLTSIEINGTFYGTQKPETFRKWAQSTPDGFIFSVKGSRFVTHRRVLGEAEESITRFVSSGITELGDRLGPLLWQFPPSKKFEPEDFGAFLALLPAKQDGVPLRHTVDVRHDSFRSPEFVALLRKHGVAPVLTDHATYPMIADVTADFVYMRLQRGDDAIKTAYSPKALDAWAERARQFAAGGAPDDLKAVGTAKLKKVPRNVFMYVIHEGKVRAPAAAMALIEKCR